MKNNDLIQPAENHLYNVSLFLIAKREPAGAAGQGPSLKGKIGEKCRPNEDSPIKSYRLLADLRYTNSCIQIIPARMERIQDIIDQIAQAKPIYYSSYTI